MKIYDWRLFLIIVWAGLPCLRAEEASDPVAGDEEALTAWEFFQEAAIEEAPDSPWLDFVLTPSVFGRARTDLADLRVYDGGGREVPYALRVRKPESDTEAVEARRFNESQGPGNISQLSLDLGQEKIEHNEVEVKMPGADFRREVRIEGSDDGEQWSRLAEKNLLHFQTGSSTFRDQSIAYSPSRFRFLRITVSPDPQVDDRAVKFDDVIVRRRIEVPGEFDTRKVRFDHREPVRADGAPGSSWTIHLGGENVPCDRILADIADPEFVRDYYIEAGGLKGDDDYPFRRIDRGVWRRRAGDNKNVRKAEFSETMAARLRLVVTDHRNPPLNIQSIQAAAPVRQIVVAKSDDLQSPLRLYFGNPKANAPNYDFARNLPKRLDPPPARLALGPRQENPTFHPEPLPLTERWPWLIYIVLGAAVLVLGLLIASLARAAIANADARKAPERQEIPEPV
jgi:hypothetical protein